MIVLIVELLLKFIGFGIKFGKNKSALEKALKDFANQHDVDIKKDVKLKRRYDERLDELRREDDRGIISNNRE